MIRSRARRLAALWHAGVWIAIGALLIWWIVGHASQSGSIQFPNRPIEIVIPYGAGGGSDTFVRTLQKGIIREQLLEQPLVIINQPGGSGTIGSRDVKDARPNGYKILCHHNAIIAAKLAGTVDYGPEAFEPIALTGELSMVILVRADVPYSDLPAMLESAKQSPRQVRFGANQGSPAYFTTLQLENAWPGADFSIVSSDGGADRYTKIIGGHLQAGIFSLSEFLDFRRSDDTPPEENVRAIALLSESRHESIPEVPTAIEQGIPILQSNANYWWAPKGTPTVVTEKLADVLEQAMKEPLVLEELNRLRVDPTFDSGESFRDRLQRTVSQFEAVVAKKETALPDFVALVAGVVFLLAIWVTVEHLRHPADDSHLGLESDGSTKKFETRPYLSMASYGALCVYVAALGTGRLPFAPGTALVIFVIGAMMIGWHPKKWLVLGQIALLTGLGMQFVFSEIFVTALP